TTAATLSRNAVYLPRTDSVFAARLFQVLTVRSRLTLASCLASAANARPVTVSPCPRSVVRSKPVAASHSLITLSVPAAASVFPCGENARHQTSPLLFRVIRSFAVRQSHRTTVISSLADASDFPSEEK